MLYSILISVQILIAVGLIALILLQQGKGADAGAAFGSGASQTVFGARGAASFMTRATAVFAFAFLANSFMLAFITSRTVERPSLVEKATEQRAFDVNAPENAPAGGDAPGERPGEQAGVPQDLIDSLNESMPEGVDLEVMSPNAREGGAEPAPPVPAAPEPPAPTPSDTP